MPEIPAELPSEEIPKFYEKHFNEGRMLHEQLAEDAAIAGVASQKKPVKELISRHSDFFDNLSNISYIHVYGFSLSEVDMPYLTHILSKVQYAHWEFSDYRNANADKIIAFCQRNNMTSYSIINLESIISSNQLTIPFPEDSM